MPKFTIAVPVNALQNCTIEADSLEDAKNRIAEGEGDFDDLYSGDEGNTDTSTYFEVK